MIENPLAISPLERLFKVLGSKGHLKIATAESCTGGILADWLTSLPGSSKYYQGGVSSYSNLAKIKLLGVPSDTIQTFGAVSGETAEAMADGVLRALDADYAVSITGVAGPGGGSKEKPVGTVWLGFSSRGRLSSKLLTLKGDRGQIRQESAKQALLGLIEWIEKN